TMVARGGHIVHWEAVGMRDIEAADPLEPDDIFRIYSMTKPVTSVAVMMLVESGDLELDDPVSNFLQSFEDLAVLEADGSRAPTARQVTVRDLLRHTGGLTYGLLHDTPVDRMYEESGLVAALGLDLTDAPAAEHEVQDLEEFVATLADLPLLAQPGEQWIYSASTDVLGYLVQVVSGRPFDEFLAERLFEPLGMDDTAFWVPAEKRHRFAAHYRRSKTGLELVDSPQSDRYTRMPPIAFGGSGLVSTPSDYVRFAQMLLQEGELDGVRILAAETVRAMRRDHLPEGVVFPDRWFGPGYGYGLGFATLVDQDATPDADHAGVHRWVGMANTFFWIDPEADLVAMVWTQMTPLGVYRLQQRFQKMVYAAMDERAHGS
ncbi:MAG: serine hydrolase domain-containing protein, partial [Thermoanaerobaculia bacterium]